LAILTKPPVVSRLAHWITPRRIRAQGLVLAICIWGIVAIDFATPGLMDRAGNIKFQDFLQFYISARLIVQGRSSQLFDMQVTADELQTLVQQPTRVRLPTVYGPQVGLIFVPLTRFSFLTAASIWAAISTLLFFLCVFFFWRLCPNLRQNPGLVIIAAFAFPPFFHFLVRGQIAAALLASFTAAFFAFRSGHDWPAGAVLGLLVFKPQFLVAIPLVFLLSRAWKALAGLATAGIAEIALTWMYFGTPVMHSYWEMLWRMSGWIGAAEVEGAHLQMHSLRSFWFLLLPWPKAVLALYALSSIPIVVIAAASWRSSGALPLRFSSLILAAVLINPHLYVYDLLVLAPALLFLVDWALGRAVHPISAPLRLFLYLSFILPLFGPVAHWTRLQLSVVAFVALQWLLWRILQAEQKDAPPRVPVTGA
jgi:glycosyl transferase family 87